MLNRKLLVEQMSNDVIDHHVLKYNRIHMEQKAIYADQMRSNRLVQCRGTMDEDVVKNMQLH